MLKRSETGIIDNDMLIPSDLVAQIMQAIQRMEVEGRNDMEKPIFDSIRRRLLKNLAVKELLMILQEVQSLEAGRMSDH